MPEKLLTIRDAATTLNISEKEVIELFEKGVIPAHKVGEAYVRFEKGQIERYKSSLKPGNGRQPPAGAYAQGEYWRDFFYFYDFYIFSALLIFFLLGIIIKG